MLYSTQSFFSNSERRGEKTFPGKRKIYVPESIESIVAAVDLNGDGPGVCFGHTAVAFHDDQLGPNLVVDLMPFVQHLLDVVLINVIR